MVVVTEFVSDLYILRSVSFTVILSTTGGILESLLQGCLAKQFLTVNRPRSATMTFDEEDDWGRKITGALKWTSRAIRELRSASSFTPEAAFSAAWTVTSARASFASWKLLINAWERKKVIRKKAKVNVWEPQLKYHNIDFSKTLSKKMKLNIINEKTPWNF